MASLEKFCTQAEPEGRIWLQVAEWAGLRSGLERAGWGAGRLGAGRAGRAVAALAGEGAFVLVHKNFLPA